MTACQNTKWRYVWTLGGPYGAYQPLTGLYEMTPCLYEMTVCLNTGWSLWSRPTPHRFVRNDAMSVRNDGMSEHWVVPMKHTNPSQVCTKWRHVCTKWRYVWTLGGPYGAYQPLTGMYEMTPCRNTKWRHVWILNDGMSEYWGAPMELLTPPRYVRNDATSEY